MICECCGETTLEFLTIDHRFGGGCRHRNSVNPSKMYLYYRSILHDPEREKKYRVLCMNCNWAIGRYGECPHQKERPSLRKAEVYLICSPQDLRNAADVIEAKANPLDPNSPNSRAEIATPSLTMTFLNQDSPDVKAACDQAEMQRRTKGGIIVPQGVVGPVQ